MCPCCDVRASGLPVPARRTVGGAWLHRSHDRSARSLARAARPARLSPSGSGTRRRGASSRTRRARCGSSAAPARARPPCCSPPSHGRLAAGEDPARTLVLVGSRRAASELRERLVRLGAGDGGTSREALVRTVHSYAFGVLRLHAARHGDPPPRLLASAEQDALVRDLLGGEVDGVVPGSGWPERIEPALAVPGFAAELRELLLRAAERGLGPDELAELGARHEVAEWAAAGRFFRCYEQVTLLRGAAGRGAPQATAPALDAAELVAAALDALAADPELLAAERERVRHLVVDDAQDLDPQQMELVGVLGRSAATVLLAGDPDQAVLTFRGADPAGMQAIDAETVVLTVDHRGAPAVRGGLRGDRRPAARRRGGAAPGRPARCRRMPSIRRRDGRAPPAGRARRSSMRRRLDGRRRAGVRAGVHLRGAGGRLDRRPAAPGASHRRRAVVADGGARALGAAGAPGAAAGALGRGRPDRRAARRVAAGPPTRGRPAADGAALRRPARRARRRRRDGAAHVPARLRRSPPHAPLAPRACSACRRRATPRRLADDRTPRPPRARADPCGRRARRERSAAGRGPARRRGGPPGSARRPARPRDGAAAPGGCPARGRGRGGARGRERRGGALAGLAGVRARTPLERRQRPRRPGRRRGRP